MRPLVLVLALAACGTDSDNTVLGDSGDTAVETDTDTDTDTDADTDSDTDADADADSDADTDSDTDTDTNALTDFTAGGGAAVSTSTGSASLTSCTMNYTRFTPAGGASGPLVVLSHGFSRGQAQMAGWAEHLASWGVEVVTPGLCHAGAFNADHAQNAADLVELVTELGASEVIYVGHSAGGLASYVAAGSDSRTVAMMGLDPVDNNLAASATVTDPHVALHGVPQQCNTQNNMAGLFDVELRVKDADHCDFESPSDFLCSLGCPSGGNTSAEAIAGVITQQLTAYVLWQAGLEPDGASYWTPGSAGYQALIASGGASAM
ncbi:MAG: alpha/beta hydrolase [Deltaproteobacteria bacterium]|nr:MAG: alpha/beta hydrolase [Deltaproteobacteria bacterium]